jgi:sigma-B regulation protein RsbU (phosphoserine phosphatase)
MNVRSAAAIHVVRPQLEDRRRRLEAAAGHVSTPNLTDLLAEVDAALQRIDEGMYGRCEVCQDPIEPERLIADPLIRFCLDHLSEPEMRAHEQDLELATQIQYKLLPPSELSSPGWRTHYYYQSAGPVGGDFCDLAPLDNGSALFFAIGDVAGKGIAASLMMVHLSAILRSLLSVRLPISEIMTRANRLFCESTLESQYATLICGRISEAGTEVSNAGHCLPLIVRAEAVERLDVAGLPLGLFYKTEYSVTQISLEPGSSLFLYTDGLTEARDPAGNEFGEERAAAWLRQVPGAEARSLNMALLNAVTAFRGAARPEDDLTMLVIRREV